MTATVLPASVSRPASGGPAWPAPMTMASNSRAMASERGGEGDHGEPAEDCDDVFGGGDRQVATAVAAHQRATGVEAAQRAQHRADHAGADGAERVVEAGADHRTGEGTGEQSRDELRRHGPRRRLG